MVRQGPSVHPLVDIEVVDLVWKGLRLFIRWAAPLAAPPIEVVDLVWKGLRHLVHLHKVGRTA